MGATTMTIIFKVLLVEARVSLIVGATIAVGTILGYPPWRELSAAAVWATSPSSMATTGMRRLS